MRTNDPTDFTTRMSREVVVTIEAITEPATEPGLDLPYVVRNAGEESVWLVDEGDLVWNRRGDLIELSFARAPLRDDVEPFGYFVPEVRELRPGEAVEKEVRLRWPESVSPLWNEETEIAPEPGSYDLRVRVGYGPYPEPDPPGLGADVDEGVLRWQREAVSDPVPVRIEEYSAG